jgi:hypothetical protein
MFIKGFNALQLTTIFAAWPFAMQWVHDGSFYAHSILFWIMAVAYCIGFLGMVLTVYDKFD